MSSSRAFTVTRALVMMAWAGFLVFVGVAAQSLSADPSVATVVRRMAEYVEAYGARASVIVASESYTQLPRVGTTSQRTRTLVSEFAIVKVADQVGWTGFRDVVEVDGKPVVDRRDRLVTLLTGPADGIAELRRLANESARYNIGLVTRNLNVPTAALFFFHPEHVGRFSFRRTSTKVIDGVTTWALEFTETQRPTMVMTRDGTDLPAEGTVWVAPGEGTVVRTKLRIRGFDGISLVTPENAAPLQGPQSLADIDVTYRLDTTSGVWFPSTMDDVYKMPVRAFRGSVNYVHTVGRATYSNLRRFETTTRIVVPK